ncbi:hypothetical protein GCM10009716_24140 [Streptomyces sodiiphilus]|uniref:Uncharacterized protein n=1 Tax=Streptomyces sodiiphilus TaxID=226217 RepID=A0ABN2P6Q9_9ACTN
MKSTITMRSLANPRRTVRVHLAEDTAQPPTAVAAAGAEELPARTANPQRTVLVDAPAG